MTRNDRIWRTGPGTRIAHASVMASYLVTGGAGFIGSHLTEELARRGQHVRIADNLSTGRWANVDHVAGVEFLEGDLADAATARRAVAGMDFVLHQAAIPSVPRSVKDPAGSHRANVEASLNVLEACRHAGVRRLVFAGSSSVYGDTPVLPKHEDMPPSPQSPYALQKLIVEQYCRLFTRLYGLETVTLRYFNVFGPRQDPGSPYSGVISRFLLAAVDGGRPMIYGDGEQTRDFTYVANVVDAVLAACDADGVAGQAINVATGSRISLNGLLAAIAALAGRKLEPMMLPARTGDIRDSLADIGRARTLLRYSPRVGFEEGLRRTWEWHRRTTTGNRMSQGEHARSQHGPASPPAG